MELESRPAFGKVEQPSASIKGDQIVLKLKDFLRISEAAEYLGVSPNTLRNWESAGKITARRHPVNDYRLFRREDLDAVLKEVERPRRLRVSK